MTTLSVVRQFSTCPGGRLKKISTFSGEAFRDDLLVPALERGGKVIVELDGVVGYGSSFLEEVFGGVVRVMHWMSREQVNAHLQIASQQESWITEANQYIDEALQRINDAASAQQSKAVH